MKNIFTVLLTFLYLTVSFADQTGTDTLTIGKKNSNNKKLQFNKSGTPAEIRWNNSTSKIQFSNDGSIFTDIGSGGSFGVNFMSANPDAETNSTTGWSVIQDTAQATPACSASPSAGTNTIASRAAAAFAGTYTASGTAVLRGTYSFEYNKATATQIGEALTYAFTIAEADKSKPHQIVFDVDTSSDYVASDMGVYVCDGTTLITPSIVNIPGGKSKFIANFNASTSTSYKLVLHVQTGNTNVYNLKLDNFQVGPQQLAVGPVKTDWTEYTTTPIGFGTVTGTKYYWRRDGDTLFVRAKFSAGTVTGTEARFPFPPGCTASSTLSDISYAGTFNRSSTSAFSYYVLREPSVSYFTFGRADGTNTGFAKLLGNALIGTGESISFIAEVQIAEWSGSGNVVNGPNVEYAYNTSTNATTSDTTSFGYGPQGNPIGSITANLNRRVRFQYPTQPTDKFYLEVSSDRITWYILDNFRVIGGSGIVPYQIQDADTYGATIYSTISSTDVDVRFGTYEQPTGLYGGAGEAWRAGGSDQYWRVKKESGVAATSLSEAVPGVSNGFLSFNGVKGFTDGSSATAGYVGETGVVALSSDTTPGSTDTDTDVTGASFTLQPGTYRIGYSMFFAVSGTSAFSGMRFKITDSSNTLVANSIASAFFSVVTGASEHGTTVTRDTFISISTATTYKVRVAKNSVNTSTVYASSITGGITNPDLSSIFYWQRIR